MFSRRKALLVAAIVVFCPNTYSSELTLQSEPMPLDTIKVNESESDTRSSINEINLKTYTGFSHVIDRSEFETRYSNLGELLNAIPGIQVKQTSGAGSAPTVSVRGSSGKQVNFFLDGLLINSPSSGIANIQHIPTVLIERVESYPDFTPAQLGNANLAGAVNFKTRQISEDEAGGHLQAAYGSFDTKHFELSAWNKFSDWQLMAAANHTSSDNNFDIDPEYFKSGYDERLNDGFRTTSYFIKADYLTNDLSNSWVLQYVDAHKELPTTLNLLRDDATLDDESWRLQTIFDHDIGDFSLAHRIYLSDENILYQDPNDNLGLRADVVDTQLTGVGMFNVLEYALDQHLLMLGLDLRHDDIKQRDKLGTYSNADSKRSTIVLSLADEWQIAAPWLLNVTYRSYWVDDKEASTVRNTETESDLTDHTMQLGLKWSVLKTLVLKANAGTAIRTPTLSEKFGLLGAYEGDPSLKTEKAKAVDLGFELNVATLSWYLSLYHKDIEDGIYQIYNSRGIGSPVNIGSAEILGIDSEIHWRPFTWLESNINISLLDTENQSDISNTNGKKLAGIYHDNLGAGFKILFSQFHAGFSYMLSKELYYNPANSVMADEKEDYSVYFTAFLDEVTLDLYLRNLKDRNHLDFNYLPTPGRSIMATVSYNF